MKRYALILVLSLAVWWETAPISGTLTDAGNDTLIVTCYPLVPPGEGVAHSDTLVMHNGTFAYTPAADTLPQEVTLTPKGTERYYALMFVPGQPVRVSGSPDDYRLEGSTFNTLYQQRDTLFRTYSQCRQYIEAHPDSDLSLYLLSQLLEQAAGHAYLRRAFPTYAATLPPDHSAELAALFKTLGRPVQDGAFAPLYRYWDEAFRRSRILQENRKSIAEGRPAPDFTLTDLQGRPVTLSTLRPLPRRDAPHEGILCPLPRPVGNSRHSLPRHRRKVAASRGAEPPAVDQRPQHRRPRRGTAVRRAELSHEDSH